MSKVTIPAGYKTPLSTYEMQRAIEFIKSNFQVNLGQALNLRRVSAPLFVDENSGLNDNLNGVERPVSFDIPDVGAQGQVVHSLAKWKRLALKRYDFKPGKGLFTDMNAIRRDEEVDNLHSIYVDQWDWEKVIERRDRTVDFLEQTVRAIVGAVVETNDALQIAFPSLHTVLDREVYFVTTQELEDRWPDYTPKQREDAICKEHHTVFLMQIGDALHRSGKTGWLIACAAACAVETIFRPYALLFWVFPLTAVWQNKRRRAACLGTAAGGFAVSLFAMAKLAAPYFSDGGMDFDGIRLLLQLHPVAAVRYECARAAALLHAAWRDDILPTLHGETTYIGGGCVTFLAVVLVAAVCLVWDKHKGRPLVLKGCALFCSAVIALVLLFMYNIDPRHMMLLAILLLGAVVVEDAAPAAVWLPSVICALL